jgi:MFS family permease
VAKKRDAPEGAHPDDAPLKPEPSADRRVVNRAELYATAFATGTAVMVIEILGTRVIGPVFGVSLFVWSALLTVTLASLAIGYYAGGVLVDRAPTRRLLSLVVLTGGVLLALTPVIRRTVLSMCEGLGPRGGSLLSAALLFAPALVALGTVGPIVVRLATDDFRATGHRVGSVYAISTAGSLIGTLVTGFLLVPLFDSNHILLGTSAVLIAAAAIPLALRGKPAALLALLVPALGFSVPTPPLPSGIKLLDRAQTLYGLVEAIEDQNRGVRFLRADHSVIGAQFTRDRSAGFAFLHLLEVLRFVRPKAKSLLQIGLGIGSLPRALRPYEANIDVVEIDPEVIRFARQYFDFSTNGRVFIEDARTFLGRTQSKYDLVVHDTFTGGSTPEHLLSLEVLERIRTILRSGGVLALNFLGAEDSPATLAVARTIHQVFPIVRTFRDGPPDERHGIANLVFFASDAAMDFTVPAHATFESDMCGRIVRSFPAWEVLTNVPPGPPITDDWNPLARLQLPISEKHFAAMNELLPSAVWVH